MYTVEEFDENKSKVLKYVLYKKRTKQEVKTKFNNIIDQEMLSDIIDELEENGYINDNNYIEKTINEFKALNNLSIKEIKYKLYSKGVSSNLIEEYISNNEDELKEYEIQSAKNIAIKKANLMEKTDLTQFLLKKGYMGSSVKEALGEIEKEN
jgi:regulatory protein